jgi:phage shock protein A
MIYDYNQLGRENPQLRTMQRELDESRAEANAYRTELAQARAELYRLEGELARMKETNRTSHQRGESSSANGHEYRARTMSKGSSTNDIQVKHFDSDSDASEDFLILRN